MMLSQPSLTQTIKHLETQVGQPLFKRHARGVELTDQGLRLIDEARALVARADAFLARALVPASGQTAQPLVIAYQPIAFVAGAQDYARRLGQLPGVSPEFHEMHTSHQVEQLMRGTIDLGIMARPAGHPPLRLHRLHVETCVVALAPDHPLTAHERLPLAALKATPICLAHRHFAPGVHDSVVGACHEAGFSPILAPPTQSYWSAASLATLGTVVAIVPESFGMLPFPGMTLRRFTENSPMLELFAAWMPGRGGQALQRALEALGPEA